MSPLSNYAKDTFIAPGLSGFTQADIPDMSRHSSQSSQWLDNHVLNIMLRGSWSPPLSAYVFNFLRRAAYAFHEHDEARRASLSSLAFRNQSPSTYAEALFHWETFLGQSWHALKLLQGAFDLTLFKKGNGSASERLHDLYNEMKHVESRIENGQMPTGATVPVWLTNAGLESVDAELSYLETGEILEFVAAWASALKDPKTAARKVKESGGALSRLLPPADPPDSTTLP